MSTCPKGQTRDTFGLPFMIDIMIIQSNIDFPYTFLLYSVLFLGKKFCVNGRDIALASLKGLIIYLPHRLSAFVNIPLETRNCLVKMT